MYTQLLVATVSFFLGMVVGYVLRCVLKEEVVLKNPKIIVLLAVSVIWVISMAVEIVNPNYHTSPLVHGLMGSIVGFFYKFEPKK